MKWAIGLPRNTIVEGGGVNSELRSNGQQQQSCHETKLDKVGGSCPEGRLASWVRARVIPLMRAALARAARSLPPDTLHHINRLICRKPDTTASPSVDIAKSLSSRR